MRNFSKLTDLAPGSNESLIFCLGGGVEVSDRFLSTPAVLGKKDTCCLPRDDTFSFRKVSDFSEVIIAEAPARQRFSPYMKRFSELKPIESGTSSYLRKIFTVFGEKDQTEGFLAGHNFEMVV